MAKTSSCSLLHSFLGKKKAQSGILCKKSAIVEHATLDALRLRSLDRAASFTLHIIHPFQPGAVVPAVLPSGFQPRSLCCLHLPPRAPGFGVLIPPRRATLCPLHGNSL